MSPLYALVLIRGHLVHPSPFVTRPTENVFGPSALGSISAVLQFYSQFYPIGAPFRLGRTLCVPSGLRRPGHRDFGHRDFDLPNPELRQTLWWH